MQSYPFTSEVTYDSDGRPNYDRTVTADFLRKFYRAYWTNGVFYNPTTSLQVTTDTGMQVKVLAGKCQINGAFAIESTDRTMVVQASDSLDRIDTVVVRLDLNRSQRDIDLYIKKGTPADNPEAPALTRNSTVYELGLANLFIAKNSTGITQQRITDTRLDTDRCGIVAQTVGDLDTSAFFAQLTAIISDLQNEIANIEQGSAVMLSAVYDTDSDGIVDNAERLGGVRASSYMQKSGGTFTGTVTARNTAIGTSAIRNIQASTTDLTAGTSSLTTGRIYLVYE